MALRRMVSGGWPRSLQLEGIGAIPLSYRGTRVWRRFGCVPACFPAVDWSAGSQSSHRCLGAQKVTSVPTLRARGGDEAFEHECADAEGEQPLTADWVTEGRSGQE